MKSFSYVLFLPFLLIFFSLQAQNEGFEGEDYNGKLELSSGEVINGDIYYEAATGKVIITNNKGSEHFSARTTSYFEFYDFERNTIRKFYSLTYNNLATFFELLKETSNIALLSRENVSSSRAVAYLSRSSDVQPDTYSDHSAEGKFNSETLFLADDKGNIFPYVVINSNKVVTSANYVSPYLLASLTKSKYTEVRKFAKQNHYSMKNREHLIDILEYYESIK